jgi:hypothetical protein
MYHKLFWPCSKFPFMLVLWFNDHSHKGSHHYASIFLPLTFYSLCAIHFCNCNFSLEWFLCGPQPRLTIQNHQWESLPTQLLDFNFVWPTYKERDHVIRIGCNSFGKFELQDSLVSNGKKWEIHLPDLGSWMHELAATRSANCSQT